VATRISVFDLHGYFWLQYIIRPGIDLIQGISIAVDDGEATNTIISTCKGSGCTGRMDLTPDLITNMKSGENLRLFFISPDNYETFVIDFSLSGFTLGFSELTQ
jgi:invasion protein IalB